MLLDELQLRESKCVALIGAGGKSTLQAILERETARAGETRVIYEAETTGGRCMTLHEEGTPVLRPETDCAVIVAGLGALDWPIREVCGNFHLRREFAAEPDRPCDGHDLLFVVRENLRAAGLPRKQLRVLLNQADTGMLHVRASDLMRALQDEGYSAVTLSLLV